MRVKKLLGGVEPGLVGLLLVIVGIWPTNWEWWVVVLPFVLLSAIIHAFLLDLL